jgi:anti-sigma B factor antagonist
MVERGVAEARGLDVEVVVDGRRALVRVAGELDAATVPKLRAALAPLGHRSGDVVVVDLGGLTFADASALGALVAVHARIEAAGARLVVRQPSPLLQRMLTITRVSEVLTVDHVGDVPAS